MTKLVKCNYAEKCSHKCAKHGYPHEVVKMNSPKFSCTQWGECYADGGKGEMVTIKVRCVRVKR